MKFTMEKVLDGAVAAFDAHGVGVSTAKVASIAGVSNGTLFNYFRTKQELVDAIYLYLKGQLAEAIGEIDAKRPLIEQSRQIYTAWFGWAAAAPERSRVAALLHQSGLVSDAAVAKMLEAFAAPARVLTDLEASGTMVDLPTDYVSALMQAQVELAVASNLNEQQRQTAFDAMWNSIAPGTTAGESP
ncbi:MAG: TetR/AcrR family transcriptional regulator [Acidobacteriota bacterium]